MDSFDLVVSEFLDDLRLAGRAARTVGEHQAELRRLGRFIELEGLDWHALRTRDIKRYCRLRADKGHSSRANMLCSLRCFTRWAASEGYMDAPPTVPSTPKRPKPLPRALTLGQVRTLVAYVAAQWRRSARRDEALILTGLYTGLRASELANLRWSVVDLSGGVLHIRLSKMGKGRAVPLHPVALRLLGRWRVCQNLGPNDAVFASVDRLHREISADRVGKIARRIAKATGLPLTTHVLRHTFATWALRNSRDLYGVSKVLGHAELKQTEIYLNADVQDLRGAVESLPDLAGW